MVRRVFTLEGSRYDARDCKNPTVVRRKLRSSVHSKRNARVGTYVPLRRMRWAGPSRSSSVVCVAILQVLLVGKALVL